jgi:hypothetical protein
MEAPAVSPDQPEGPPIILGKPNRAHIRRVLPPQGTHKSPGGACG